jgi:hypothetical protein
MSDTEARDQLAQLIYATLNGQYGDFNMPDDAADKIIAAGWRPPALVIETGEELCSLGVGTIIRSGDGMAWIRVDSGLIGRRWMSADGNPAGLSSNGVIRRGPATVLYEPK